MEKMGRLGKTTQPGLPNTGSTHSRAILGRSKSSNRGKTCNFCKKKGYIKSECYKLQNKIKREATNQKGKQPENSGEANVVEDYNDGELLVASINNSKVSEEWILDTRCTFHMSPNRDWFTTYKTVLEGVVLMGNNASCKIAGVGIIKVKLMELSEYLGFTVTSNAAIASSSLSNDDITKLWHIRLGHMRENAMAELSKRGLLNGQGIYKLKFSSIACFFINRSPSVAIEKKTPQEVWSGNLVDYSDLKIFGSPAYAHIDNGKLEPRSIKCVFLGYKAGVKGQIPGVDFTDVFSPVVKHSSIRVLLGTVAMHDLELEQLDVKPEFSHGELDEDIYIQQPEDIYAWYYGCLLAEKVPLRFETPRQWYKRFDSFMPSHDFKRSTFDSFVYFKKNSDGSFVYLLLYVNDMLIAAKDKGEIRKVKAQLSEEFEMKDLGPAKKILGMEILRDKKASKLYLSQKGYIEKVFCRFNMQSAKPVSTPLAAHFRLSSALSPQSNDEIEYMLHVSYSNAVGFLILEELEIESLGKLMLILLETLIEEDLSQVMSLQSEVVQSVGKPLCKLQSLCLPLKLSTW
ncbi:hypothetical protein CXB51_016978 [Gossypium anomalum]|uniref:Reverse transcriptase Ty1/copia-type domain-containing protein n=1 Tax=Gossypium anomalum TaxID=47600 RepID=A0A8J6CVJ1_9ROSI|nr:hypothetical protein CXB51_016978 [Gossypium anomalum]